MKQESPPDTFGECERLVLPSLRRPGITTLILIVCLLFLAVIDTASAQDRSGTIIIVAGSQNKIVMAADSRESMIRRNGSKSIDDTECKIVTLPRKLVFAPAGRVGHKNTTDPTLSWDSYDIARDAAKTVEISGGSIEATAHLWADKVAAMHDQDLARAVITSNKASDNIIEYAFFAGFEGGIPLVYRTIIFKNKESTGPKYLKITDGPLKMAEWRFYRIGVFDIADEFSAQQSDRAISWLATFRSEHPAEAPWETLLSPLSERIIQLTDLYSSEKDSVGGPIDVIEIGPDGNQWVRKKQNCGD